MADQIAILVLDPDEHTVAECTAAFAGRGWKTDCVSTFREAMELGPAQYYDVAIIELLLPDMDGIEAWSQIRILSPSTVGIITTSSNSLRNSVCALEPGILTYLQKPLRMPMLCDFIERAVKGRRVARETKKFERQLMGLSNLLSTVSHSSMPEQVLKKTLTYIRSAFHYDWVVMYLLNEDKSSCTRVVQLRLLPQIEELTEAQSEFIQQRIVEVVHSLQPQVLIQSVTSVLDSRALALQELGLRDLVLLPVIGSAEPYGVLAVINCLESDASFVPSDAAFLKVLSQAIALALERADLAKTLETEGLFDPATGLCTPAYLSRLVEAEVARWKRHARPFSLVVIDMPDQQPCYRGNGDPVRWQAFCEIAGMTGSLVRRSDVVAQVCDYQLAILLPETEQIGAQRVINRFEEAIGVRLAARTSAPAPTIRSRVVMPSKETDCLRDLLRSANV